MSKETGGPAYPVRGGITDNQCNGMDLRDYFAAKALQGLLACSSEDYEGERTRRTDYQKYCENFAYSAYEFADAMIEARK